MNGLTRRLAASALAIGFASMWLAVPGGAAAAVGPTLGQVEHIVVIVHEGRTFDSILGRYPGIDGIAATEQRADMIIDEPPLAADSVAAATAWANGANTGFVTAQQVRGLSSGAPLRVARRALVPATWELAKLGVVGQRAFADVLGGSAANRRALFGYPIPIVSGTVSDATLPPLTGGSLLDSLDLAGIGWSVFIEGFDPDAGLPTGLELGRLVGLVPPLSDPTITAEQTRLDKFVSLDAFHEAVETGTLPAVSYVIGTAGVGPAGAAADLTAEVTNAVSRSSAWSSTVIVDTWDGWGGFADHVAPPVVGGRQLGFRVPLILGGPLVAAGTVDSTVRSHASIVRLVLDRYGLAPRDSAQAAANSLADLVTADGSRPPTLLRDDAPRFLPGVPWRERVLAVYVLGIIGAIGIVVAAVVIDRVRRSRGQTGGDAGTDAGADADAGAGDST